jgi:hypothetical protein
MAGKQIKVNVVFAVTRNMVNPGKDCPKTYTCDEIGEATVAVLRRVMPAAMPV